MVAPTSEIALGRVLLVIETGIETEIETETETETGTEIVIGSASVRLREKGRERGRENENENENEKERGTVIVTEFAPRRPLPRLVVLLQRQVRPEGTGTGTEIAIGIGIETEIGSGIESGTEIEGTATVEINVLGTCVISEGQSHEGISPLRLSRQPPKRAGGEE